MKRRSASSNWVSTSTLVGDTPIPSSLGQTITGAISNLASRSSEGEWVLLKEFNGSDSMPIDPDDYIEFLLAVKYPYGTYGAQCFNAVFFPAACIGLGFKEWASQMAQSSTIFHTAIATFNTSTNTVSFSGNQGIFMGHTKA